VILPKYKCLSCRHTWIPRYDKKPVRCPKCKSLCTKIDTNDTRNEETPSINCSVRGAIVELRVEVDLLSKGYHVFRSESPACPCDLVVIKDGLCAKVEVRTVSYLDKNGEVPKSAYSENSEHIPGFIDWWALWVVDRIIYVKSKSSKCELRLDEAPHVP
jgi:DNA-directed RNA polymerase subunit RPC12/RpoP